MIQSNSVIWNPVPDWYQIGKLCNIVLSMSKHQLTDYKVLKISASCEHRFLKPLLENRLWCHSYIKTKRVSHVFSLMSIQCIVYLYLVWWLLTGEDGERDDLSDVIESLGGTVRRPDTANSHTSHTSADHSLHSRHSHHSQHSQQVRVVRAATCLEYWLKATICFFKCLILHLN